jgi:3-hydroxy-9,10-secoandrosta-1,3,5(10)-triene-9,17-dione monooxygenase
MPATLQAMAMGAGVPLANNEETTLVTAINWTPSATLPAKAKSFTGVGYDEMVRRAASLVPRLRELAPACEQLGRLADENERLLHEQGLFRIVQPARVGGADLDVGILVDTCAEIARVCPSTAWNLGNLGSHHWMLGYFPPQAQDEIWDRSPDILIATSLVFPAGRARKVDGGYVVSGRWPFSSGVDNSDWNMLAVTVRESDDGPPIDQRFALLHRSQYEIIDNWQAMGLCGTGSKDVRCADIYVPAWRTLAARDLAGDPHPGSTVNAGPLFRLPMLALGPYVLSGVLLGCAIGAYELTVGAARKRNATTTGVPVGAAVPVQIRVAEAAGLIDAAGLVMRRNCAQAMDVARSGGPVTMDDKLRYRRDGAMAARMCLQAVDIMMGVSGAGGLYTTNDMQRLFRDAHAAAAHVMFSFDTQVAMFGQHALGVAGPAPLL